MRTILLLVLLSSLLVSGCGQILTPKPEQSPMPEATPISPASSGKWTIRMVHSGGIMGISRSIEVSSDGKFTITDNRTNKTVTGELAAGDLSKLNELLVSIGDRSAGKPNGVVCADCFVYDLEIQRGGKGFAFQLNDISLPNSGYESLIDQLRDLMDTALK